MAIDLVTAAKAKMMVEDLGMSENKAAQELDINHGTVGQIVNGEGRWANITEKDPLFNKIRQQQKEKWWKWIWSLQPKLLKNIEDKMDGASAASSAWIFGVLFDKERLLAGESTQNIAVAHHVEVEGLDVAADRIAHSLLRFSADSNAVSSPQNEPIDVTPEPNNIRSEGKDK